MSKLIALPALFACCALACAARVEVAARPSAPAAPAAPMIAADNGQPEMRAAFDALEHARAELEAAEPNKGGHRERAIGVVQQALVAVREGMQYAAAHPTELGEVAPEAGWVPVSENVPGAERQPRMAAAMVYLREAQKQLQHAKHDKGGFRVKAIGLTEEAEKQVHEGIRFADKH